MCDPLTEAENAAYLNRRQVTALGAAGAAMAALPTGPLSATTYDYTPAIGFQFQTVTIALPDGACDAFLVFKTVQPPQVPTARDGSWMAVWLYLPLRVTKKLGVR